VLIGVQGASERKTYVRSCRATCRGALPFCDIHLQQESTRPAWGLAAVAELRSSATAPPLLVGRVLHRFPVRLLPRPLIKHLLSLWTGLGMKGQARRGFGTNKWVLIGIVTTGLIQLLLCQVCSVAQIGTDKVGVGQVGVGQVGAV